MPEYRDLMAAFREQSRLSSEAAQRLRDGLDQPAPAPAWRRPALVALAASALGAIALWGLLDQPPAPIGGPLNSGPLTAEVQLQVSGVGSATGTAREVQLQWQAGTLNVELEPERGVSLVVQTEEATTRVVGTGFAVLRDALGTTVLVRHGAVEVQCVGGAARRLLANDQQNCPPRSAAGRLGRVRALQDSGAENTLLLDELEAALSLPDATGDVALELYSVQLDTLLRMDRRDDALALAETLARHDGPRTLEAHRVAARLRLSLPSGPDCAGALPHLRALAAKDRLEADAPWLTTCEKESTP